MRRSLVGSEMCIRDRIEPVPPVVKTSGPGQGEALARRACDYDVDSAAVYKTGDPVDGVVGEKVHVLAKSAAVVASESAKGRSIVVDAEHDLIAGLSKAEGKASAA